jgi:predicted esterase YcpF (UPF0227 family)
MKKIFKIIKPISKNQYSWIDFDIEVGTMIKMVSDVYRVMDPALGILAKIPNQKGNFGIPFGHIEPIHEYKKTIILLHGFNSGPGEKEQQLNTWLQNNNLNKEYTVIAPQLHNNPSMALTSLAYLIQEHYGDVTLIGTSLGGFYANYMRALNPSTHLKVHAINPSWTPGVTLERELGKELINFKTGRKSTIDEKFLSTMHNLTTEIEENLKNYTGPDYTLHLAKTDELLNFEEMLAYLDEHKVNYRRFDYNTNHRFEKMMELLNNIKEQLSIV